MRSSSQCSIPTLPSVAGFTDMTSTSPPLYSPSMSSHFASTTSSESHMQSMTTVSSVSSPRPHTNPVIEAAKVRARDEADTRALFHLAQRACRIYNPEIEPEHETTLMCDCAVHKYWERKLDRLDVQDQWSRAVMYPGEKAYHDCTRLRFKNHNPYSFKITSPFSLVNFPLTGMAKPDPYYHLEFLEQTRAQDLALNKIAEEAIEALEPSFNIWDLEQLESLVSNMSTNRRSSLTNGSDIERASKRTGFKKAFSMKSSDERTAAKMRKKFAGSTELRDEILAEEQGRWQNSTDRQVVATYQENMGISQQVVELRKHRPVQYLHLLRAGYFEPIITSWDGQPPSLLGFIIDAATGWRGFTPTWRGYNTIAEERLYWVLRHRHGKRPISKLHFIHELDMARSRMAEAVEPREAPESSDEIRAARDSSPRYTTQVPPILHGIRTPISSSDETMVLLDTSSSMNNPPMSPEYTNYLITSHHKVDQPKGKDIAKSMMKRFVEAMRNYDDSQRGYPLTTFSQSAEYIGTVHGWELDEIWQEMRFIGRSQIMPGWQKLKELHFRKHSATATYHSKYGWQAGPHTSRLRAFVILNGEPNDIDEFELELIGLHWAYVTILLIGTEGCLNHHRSANRLNRMSEVNSRVSFVAAQGHIPERMITHEILKRHLGYDIPISRFHELERPLPAELQSSFPARHRRTLSSPADLEDLPVELPSPEETMNWQSQQQAMSIRGLAELSSEREFAELPASGRWQSHRNLPDHTSFREPPPSYLESV